jgi:nucleotide-binding universal stress UspA family protein
MFKKIAVAYNESPEAQRAFASAMQLARTLGAELATITVMADLPAYSAFASAGDSSLGQVLLNDRLNFYKVLEDKARTTAELHEVVLTSHILEGKQVESIVSFLREYRADLLVIGLHQRDLYIARLWSTVYELAQDAPCSVLGVH